MTEKVARTGNYKCLLPTITSKISSADPFLVDEWKKNQSMSDKPVKVTIPGPMTIADTIANTYYKSDEEMGYDLAIAINIEIKRLVDAGCKYIQIDEPVFARKPEEANSYGMENLERMMHGIPKDVQRVCHICCGYPNSLDSKGYKK